jgi:hypothetical protein
MQQKAVAVAADGEGRVQHFGIGQGLLHAVPDRKIGLFGLDDAMGTLGRA